MYITDQFNHRIRRVAAGGTIDDRREWNGGLRGRRGTGGERGTELSGRTGGGYLQQRLPRRRRQQSGARSGLGRDDHHGCGERDDGFSGDGAAATAAQLNATFGVALDGAGDLYLADSMNNRIRKVSAVSPVTPQFTSASITNAASFVNGGVAGGIGTLFGVHLSVGVSGIQGVGKLPLPDSLAGVTLNLNGNAVPLFAVVNANGSEQINFQFPWELAGQTSVTAVLSNGVSSSAQVSFPISRSSRESSLTMA